MNTGSRHSLLGPCVGLSVALLFCFERSALTRQGVQHALCTWADVRFQMQDVCCLTKCFTLRGSGTVGVSHSGESDLL